MQYNGKPELNYDTDNYLFLVNKGMYLFFNIKWVKTLLMIKLIDQLLSHPNMNN